MIVKDIDMQKTGRYQLYMSQRIKLLMLLFFAGIVINKFYCVVS